MNHIKKDWYCLLYGPKYSNFKLELARIWLLEIYSSERKSKFAFKTKAQLTLEKTLKYIENFVGLRKSTRIYCEE